MRARVLLGLVVSLTLAAPAQVTNPPVHRRPLSLRESLELALSRNLDVQIVHLTTEIAGYNLSGAYGPYMPLFSFRADHDFIDAPGDYDPHKFNPDFPYQLNTDTLGPALSGKLPMGFSYDLSAFTREDNARTDFSSDLEEDRLFPGGIRRTNNYYSEARLVLRQHLLRDFWIDADREQLLVRRKELKMSQQAMRFQIMKTLLAVEVSYYDLIGARERMQVEEKALELRQRLVSETRRRVEVGDLPPLDRDQAETQLQNTLTALSAAREVFLASENVLKGLLTDNYLEWADQELDPIEALLAMPVELNRSAIFQNALKNRPDLLEARMAVETRAVMVAFRKNQLFPSLDLVGKYGGLGVDADYGNSINNTLSFVNPEYFYGVVVSFPLNNIGERGSFHASQAAKQIAELQLHKAEQEVLLQVADLVNRAQSRFSQVTSTRKARTFAEAALVAEQKKLQNGLSTAFVVLQLQETLTAARMAEVQATADYNKILAQLAFAEGSTLDRHHLSLEVK